MFDDDEAAALLDVVVGFDLAEDDGTVEVVDVVDDVDVVVGVDEVAAAEVVKG